MLFPYFSIREIKREGVSSIAIFYLLLAVFVVVGFLKWSDWTFQSAQQRPGGQFVIQEAATDADTPTPVQDFVYITPGVDYLATPTPVDYFAPTLGAGVTNTLSPTNTPDYAQTELFTLTALYEALSLTPLPSPTFTPTGWVWIAPVTVVWLPQTVEVPVTVISHEVQVYETIVVVTAVPTRTSSPTPSPSPAPTITPTSTQTPTPTLEATPEITAESTIEVTGEASS